MNPNDLKQFPQLRDLSAEELEILVPLLDERLVDTGRRIVNEGEDAEGMILIAEGSVRIKNANGHESALKAPVVLGATALVAVGARALTAVAAEPCAVRVLSRTSFHRFAEDAPRAAVRILEAIVADLASLLRQSLDHV